MAAKISFKQQCPSCEAMVPIRDPKLIGRKIDCPKCKYRFVVEEPAEEEEEELDDSPPKKGGATGITNKKPAAGKAAPKRRGDDDDDDEARPKKKASGGNSGILIIGIALAAVAVIALGVGGWLLFGGDSNDPSKSSGGPRANVPGNPAEGQQEDQQAQNKKTEKAKPRLEDVTNLLPNETQIVVNLPMGILLGNNAFNQAVLRTPGSFNAAAFQKIWGIHPKEVSRVVMGVNLEKKAVFSVMRLTQPIKEDQIVAGLNLKAETPIGGKNYYLLQRPLDALSTFLLKMNETRDKVALHFLDSFTVVCADPEAVQKFLKEKGHPKHLTESPAAAAKPAAGNDAPGGAPGEPSAPNAPGGAAPGGPGAPAAPPAGNPGGVGGFRPPSMPGAPGMPGTQPGSGSSSGAAPVSSSYLTVDPHLKAVLDQVEKADKKEGQAVLVSVAVNTSAVDVALLKKLAALLYPDAPPVPDFLIKLNLEQIQQKLKAAGFSLTELTNSKASVAVAVAAKDAKMAQDWEKQLVLVLPDLIDQTGLDLIAKNDKQNNASGVPGEMQPPGGFQPPGPGTPGPGTPAGRRRRPPNEFPGAPGPGFQPGMQPLDGEGEKDERTGKDGDYLGWTDDNVLALGANLNIKKSAYVKLSIGLGEVFKALRGGAEVSDNRSRIHELAAATQAFLQKEGRFPRGTVPRVSDSFLGSRPDQRLSWMIQLLPYVANGEFKELLTKTDSGKSWNEEENLLAATTVIPQFLTPLPPDKWFGYYVAYPGVHETPFLAATHFVGMAGVGLDAAEYAADDTAKAKLRGIFGYDRETKPNEIKDGLAQTILLIQVPRSPRSPWLAGGGSTVRGVSTDDDCVQPFVCAEHEGKPGTFAIMADGKVRFIPANIDPKTFRALCTIAGGEKIKDIDAVAPEVPSPDEPIIQPELKAAQPAPPVQVNPPAAKDKEPATKPAPPAPANPPAAKDKTPDGK